jgi:hypothetical protein
MFAKGVETHRSRTTVLDGPSLLFSQVSLDCVKLSMKTFHHRCLNSWWIFVQQSRTPLAALEHENGLEGTQDDFSYCILESGMLSHLLKIYLIDKDCTLDAHCVMIITNGIHSSTPTVCIRLPQIDHIRNENFPSFCSAHSGEWSTKVMFSVLNEWAY